MIYPILELCDGIAKLEFAKEIFLLSVHVGLNRAFSIYKHSNGTYCGRVDAQVVSGFFLITYRITTWYLSSSLCY
jgi:hypothetical protein